MTKKKATEKISEIKKKVKEEKRKEEKDEAVFRQAFKSHSIKDKKTKSTYLKAFIISLIIVLSGVGYVLFKKGLLVPVIVDKKPVFITTMVARAYQSSKAEVANTIIIQKILDSEYKKNNITVTDEEIKQEMQKQAKIFGSEQAFRDYLKSNNLNPEKVVADQLKAQKLFDKLFPEPKPEDITDEEIDKYLEDKDNLDSIKEELGKDYTKDKAREVARDRLLAEKQNERQMKIYDWLKKQLKDRVIYIDPSLDQSDMF